VSVNPPMSYSYGRRFFCLAAHTSRATRGPWWRAWSATQRRCFGGSRRQRSNSVSAAPTAPARRLAPLAKPGIPSLCLIDHRALPGLRVAALTNSSQIV
jgi:hypothetical protein